MSPIKEPNYFSQLDMQREYFSRNYTNSIDINLDNYFVGPMTRHVHIADIRNWNDYIQLFRNVRDEVAIGEASNSYLFCPSAAENISKMIPTAKIVAILRNPVQRAWSHYLMSRRLGFTLSTNFLKEFRRDSAQKPSGWGITHNYCELGMYSRQLARYYASFPIEQIKVVLYDDYYRSPEETLKEISQFLGVNTNQKVDLPEKVNQAALPRFRTLNYLLFRSGLVSKLKRVAPIKMISYAENLLFTNSSIPVLRQEESHFLKELYRDDIGRLADLLQRDLSNWLSD